MADYSDANVSYLDVHNPDATMVAAAAEYDPVITLAALAGDGSTDDTEGLQAYLDLAQASANHACHIMLGAGKTYKITDTLQIHKGIGLRIMGGGFSMSAGSDGMDVMNYGCTLMWGGTTNIPMIEVADHAGLSIDGVALNNPDETAGVNGIQVHLTNAPGVNGARHFYRNMSFNFLDYGWAHEGANYTGDAAGVEVNGDTYLFDNCDFTACVSGGVLIDSQGDMGTWLRQPRFAQLYGAPCITLGTTADNGATGSGGNLRVDNAFMANSAHFIEAFNVSSSNKGIVVDGLKMDASGYVYRPIIYSEGLLTGGGAQGRGRGNVVFRNMNMSESMKCSGTIQSVTESDGSCLLHLAHDGASQAAYALSIHPNMVIHLDNSDIAAYNYSVSGTVTNGIEHTVQAAAVAGSGEFTVLTDIAYTSDAATQGTWANVTPLFRQRGGSSLLIADSYFTAESWKDASLILSQNSDYGGGRSSNIVVERCGHFPRPTSSASGEYITLTDLESTGSYPFYRFQDMHQTDGYNAPWSEANYGDTGIQARGRLRARARVT